MLFLWDEPRQDQGMKPPAVVQSQNAGSVRSTRQNLSRPPSPSSTLYEPSINMDTFKAVIEEGNKFEFDNLKLVTDMWAFHVLDVVEVVGYMPESVKQEMIWDKKNFHIKELAREIILDPPLQPGEDAAAAVRRALSDLCYQNRGRFNNCLDKWLAKPAPQRDFHLIHNTQAQWQNLSMPLPLRGLFGIVTVGVHLNMYTVKLVDGHEVVDSIWVSQRAHGDNVSYSGMLDQVVAGGMDPNDRHIYMLSPWMTLKREASEEAGLLLDAETKTMSTISTTGSTIIGTVCDAPYITFYDCKDQKAGVGTCGHLEPGVRFVYDLKLLDSAFRPRKEERNIEKFESFSVNEVKEQLLNKRWKPNCGLVMLDFLLRHRLVNGVYGDEIGGVGPGLRRELPFEYVGGGLPFLYRG
ncbi:hypothetical protein G7046_g5279 [Stylonectria norvegica]|nr:hypothetical protein G7046_g5279 [Stylonectria norvegica]